MRDLMHASKQARHVRLCSNASCYCQAIKHTAVAVRFPVASATSDMLASFHLYKRLLSFTEPCMTRWLLHATHTGLCRV